MFDLNEARRMARSYARQNDQIGIMLGLTIEALLQAQGEAQRWEAKATRLRAALEAAQSIFWMAEAYADGGGSHGPERHDYDEADAIVRAALAGPDGR